MSVRLWCLLHAALAPILGGQSLGPAKIHLRAGETREWRSFPAASPGPDASIKFKARPNQTEYALVLRQRDVKNRDWTVTLNDRVLGVLQEDERAMIRMLPVPAHSLREGDNTLRIAGQPNGRFSDDIELRDLRIEPFAVGKLLSQATVSIDVSSSAGIMPVKLTIVDDDGSLIPFTSLRASAYEAQRTGVLYTADGKARVGLPAGNYRVYASRGFEYGAPMQQLRLSEGDVRSVNLTISRELELPGFVSCDTHVHTFELSRHGDASIDERVLTAAGEGLDAIIVTEHNQVADYTPAIVRHRLHPWIVSIPGNEFTTPIGHFNIFPAHLKTPQPDPREKDWSTLMDSIRKTKGVQVIVQNHPRDVHSGYRPFDPAHHLSSVGTNLIGRPFRANAVEVVNSGAMASDPLQLVRDWLGLLSHGYAVAAIGASDTHTVDFVPIGQARTYVEAAQPEGIARGIIDGRSLVSYGLATALRSGGPVRRKPKQAEVRIEIAVHGPSWSKADSVTLYSNGQPVWREDIAEQRQAGVKWAKKLTLALPGHDTALVAVATGPGVLLPFWEVRKPYQATSDDWAPMVLGVSAAIWVDADGDGARTAPRGYAQRLISEHASNMPGLVQALSDFDASVTLQALDLLRESGAQLATGVVQSAFASAPSHVQQAYSRYLQELSRTRDAGRLAAEGVSRSQPRASRTSDNAKRSRRL